MRMSRGSRTRTGSTPARAASPPPRSDGMRGDPVELVTGVWLAGGLARRMGGGDKCLRDLAGKPMLAHVIERLQPQVGAMVINANGDPGRFAAFGLDVVPDTVGGFAGPLAGVLAGMRWSATRAPDAQWIVTVS